MLETKFGSGKAVQRVEDDRLLRGQGLYVDDATAAGTKHVCFVRSPYASADILSVDTSAAQQAAGVHLVLTGADLLAAGVPAMAKPINFKRPDGSPLQTPERHLLATTRVRFVGEPVAVVVADSIAQAQAAAELVDVSYEPRPVAADMAQALAPDAPLLADGPDNICAQTHFGDTAAVNEAFAKAAHVTSLDIQHQRLAAITIEPRNSIATMRDNRLEFRATSQAPTQMRAALSHHLGLPVEAIRVVVGDVGGGFGMKTATYAEDLLTAYCAHRLGGAVKWVSSRSEDFLTSSHGRGVDTKIDIALDAEGKILALRFHNHADVGAYPTMAGVAIQVLIGPWVSTSIYDIPLIDATLTAVLTNRAPTGAYRGAGRPEAILSIERALDEAARAHGFDRLELRRVNIIPESKMPYTNAMGQTYDTGAFGRIFERGLAVAKVDDFELRATTSAQRGKWRGLGVASFLEWTGGNSFTEEVNIQILADGSVEVFTAVLPMGQGIQTSLTQLVADVFDLPAEKIRVVMGDTDRGNGFGSAGSRSIFTGGGAVSEGSTKALELARSLAAEALETAVEDLDYAQARFTIKGTDVAIELGDVAKLRAEQRIVVESSTTAGAPTWPNGCHVCEVEVNPETGECEVVAYSSVNDVGRVISPTIVRGQLDGGAVQGIGQALYENLIYETHGAQLISGSLMDYAVPHADVMQVDFVTEMDESIPCKTNVLGVKGVGELGTIGATPAVVNAIAHALARNGHGHKTPQLQMPLTPLNVWQTIHEQ
ncbi:xanthine dehydrogenase family protein molybdopterin-binding subunit [Betaproteobacteria bacterium LSUCC0117]|nr:xanthine dehydrogenase family protein molybdopterin-binding subunit [Betaproteobacteria bacterium LSUCC0117]